MIETKELRIGNNVMDPTGHIVRVNCINCPDTYYGYCYPIPLTPEILLASGFERVQLGWDKPDNDNVSLYQFAENPIIMAWNENIVGNPLKYLHQLQNLIFFLTGKELECNTKDFNIQKKAPKI